MLYNPTLERLRQMGLSGMAQALEEQDQSPKLMETASFGERLGLLVDAEWSYRTQRLFERRLKDAHLRFSQASMEDLDLHTPRGLDHQVMRILASDRWIEEHLSVLIAGPTGVGALTAPQARDLLEVIDDRTQARSTVVASQFPIEQWHGVIQDPTLADAILDRLAHQSYRLVMSGESMRKRGTQVTVEPNAGGEA